VTSPDGGPTPAPSTEGPGLRALLQEVVERVEGVAELGDRIQALLQAVMSIGSHLELSEVLHTIAETAAGLVGARYGALGVLDQHGHEELSDFITVGLDDDLRAEIGELPHGRGVLGLLIREPHALRLADLTQHPASYGFPAGHPPMRSFLGVPILVRQEVYGNLYLTEKHGGGEFTAYDEQIVLTLATAAGLAVQNARLYEQARSRQDWLQAAQEITASLLGGTAVSAVFPEIVAAARRLAAADISLLAIPQSNGSVVVEAADGMSAERVMGDTLPADSLTAMVMRDGKPVLIADARLDPRVRQGALQEAGFGATLYVPLGSGRSTGTLVVARAGGSPVFDDDILPLVQSFADQAAIALQLRKAAADREQLAVLGDRDRIARDLHDLVIQRLFATGMALEGALRGMEPPERADRVRRAVDDLDTTIKEIRTAIFALQDHVTETPGVRSEVLKVCATAAQTLGFEPEVTFGGPVDTVTSMDVTAHLLAVLREALSNAARHAAATRVAVGLTANGESVTLVVTDDGKGLPETGRRSGLSNLAERAATLGGTFTVTSPRGGGTHLCWRVPLHR
jgi:signal transduction histidine kinase